MKSLYFGPIKLNILVYILKVIPVSLGYLTPVEGFMGSLIALCLF